MALYNQNYAGDGVKTDGWFFNFPYFQSADVRVKIDGVILNGNQYAARGTEAGAPGGAPYIGGEIQFAAAPAAGAAIEIYREIKLERPVDYQPTLAPSAAAMNTDADFFLEILKELRHAIGNIGLIADLPDMQGLTDSIAEAEARIAALGDLSGFATSAEMQEIAGQLSEIDAAVEALRQTVDGADWVVESAGGLSGTGYTNGWYRKYKSGWIEQGGDSVIGVSTTGGVTTAISLPVAMANASYSVNGAPNNSPAGNYAQFEFLLSRGKNTLSAATFRNQPIDYSVSAFGISWRVAGVGE